MANQDLFKQAIAEAKSIREVAIANAKEALEETLTPHLKELLAAKLQEMEEKDEDLDEGQGNIDADEKNPHDQLEEAEDDEADETEVEDEESEESEEDETEETELEDEEEMDISDMEVEDLKNMIRDIVAQEMGDEGMDYGDEMDGMDMSPDMEGQPDDMVGSDYDDTDEEEINLDELLAELDEMSSTNKINEAKKKKSKDDDDKKKKEEMKKKEEEAKKDKAKLKEAIQTINILRGQLSEVNILNAKLLYLNKVLKANNLTENQKANIITAFDKANSVKEVKLVYETVKDSFSTVKTVTKKPITESRGFASAAQGNSTKPQVINEVNEQVLRMQKLAGIIK